MVTVGEPHYLSTLPLYHELSSRLGSSYAIESAGLTELTHRLAHRDIDAGPVTVVDYLRAPDKFEVLPNLGLSSLGRSLCVSLFSRKPAYELAEARIAVPIKAGGPVALLRWLMREMYRFEPVLVPRTGGLAESMASHDAVLLFQDAALEAHAGTSDLYHVWDLGEAWWQITNTPLVYMLWATRPGLDPERRLEIQRAFDGARVDIAARRSRILDAAQQRTPLPRHLLEGYFTRFQYEFTPAQQQGLELYAQTVAPLVLVSP